MSRITDVEPQINMYEKSESYGVPFGVILWRSDGSSSRKSFDLALCANLTKSQRKYVEGLKEDARNNINQFANL